MPFRFDPDSLRYRDERGRAVPREAVRSAVDAVADAVADDMAALAERLVAGRITLESFHRRMESSIKRAVIAGTASSAGGVRRLTDEARIWAEGRILDEYRFLRERVARIRSGEQPLDGTLVARARMYAGSAVTASEARHSLLMERGGYREAKRQLGAARNCGPCLAHAARGWVSVDDPDPLPDTGERCDCKSNCRCIKIFRGRDRGRIAEVEPPREIPPPAPPPPVPSRMPGTPILPGRPIAERIAAYRDGEGGRRLAAIRGLDADAGPARRRLEEASAAEARAMDRYRSAPAGPAEAAADREFEEAHRRTVAARREAEAATRATRASLVRAIGVPDPVAFEPEGEAGVAGARDEALAFVSALTSGAGERGPMRPRFIAEPAGTRASYGVGIRMAPEADARVAVHELGHFLDDRMLLGEPAREFLAHRVGDEAPRPMRDFGDHYRADEMGRDDDFMRAFGDPMTARYAGMVYGRERTSEITSLGLERLYRDPIGFAAGDPEYAAFLLGLLDGSLR